MSTFAPTLEAFFTERLMNQRAASEHTVASYCDTFRLLLCFAERQSSKAPSDLDFSDVDAPLIGAFLDHLEHERGNSVRTRNTRLAAIHSMYRFAALSHPDHAALIQRVLAIPTKRGVRTDVTFLEPDEVDAVLDAVDRTRWVGRRDHALLVLGVQSGLRVSELTGLTCGDIHLGKGAHVRCTGKGRKERCTPLTSNTIAVLGAWLNERGGAPGDPLFSTSTGRRLSRDAVALFLSKYTRIAQVGCPTLKTKRISPHVMRHTCAMALLRAGVEITVLALWLGHESIEATQIYIHADMAIKERALARTAPLDATPGRYRASDALMAFLDSL